MTKSKNGKGGGNISTAGGVLVTISFVPESEHPEEAQRQGWQSILDNFARHVVARHNAH